MSAIPPNLAGAILQAGVQQQNVARVQDSEREQQENAALKGAQRSEHASEAIGDQDDETQVNSDSEGAGSQGRAFQSSDDDPATTDDSATSAGGISRDEDGQLHIDLEA
jgi:hypothetical protein